MTKPQIAIFAATGAIARGVAAAFAARGPRLWLAGRDARTADFAATCGAVEALTRALAGDFGPRGVRVNCGQFVGQG